MIRPIARALLVLMGLSGAPVLAQPFRTQAVPPPSPAPEAQRAFRARIGEPALRLAGLEKVPPKRRQALAEFVLGNGLFVATHEVGHALLLETGLLTIGGREQAADDFAALAALKIGEKEFSDRVLIEAAKGWFTHARRAKQQDGTHYYDRHGMEERRAYRMVCLLVGADPARFRRLAEEPPLPKELGRRCGWDYDGVSQSWERALAPHRLAAGQPRVRIDVSYGPASGHLTGYANLFRDVHFLETIAEFASRYAWRQPIVLEMRSCREAGAGWTAATRTLHVCYELARDFAELYRDFGASR